MNTPFNVEEWVKKNSETIAEPWYRFNRVLTLLEKTSSPINKGRWLDVGCQVGHFLKIVQGRYGIKPTGIDDYNENNVIEVFRRHMQLDIKSPNDIINDSWRYFSRRIEINGFNINEEFDYISALEIIEHMIDTDAFLKECRGALTMGGKLIITTPNINSLRNRILVPLGYYPSGMEYRTVVHHVRLYNPSALKAHAENFNFKLIALSGVNFLPRKLLTNSILRKIDPILCNKFPALCGGFIAIFEAC